MTMLFCNVGWMERYQGLLHGDTIRGGGAYVKKEGRGHEICNFSPYKDVLYGYVQPPGSQIDIERIGAKSDDNSISGITVVWTATLPSGGTAIVGWYKEATVFKDFQKFRTIPPSQSRNHINDGYWVKAPAQQATVLPPDARFFVIPRRQKGFMGQSNVWYADSSESAGLVRKVQELIKNGWRIPAGSKKPGNRQDQEKKARVEKAAIRVCCDYFEGLGYKVGSVEKDNFGWDLEAIHGKATLRIEVKGLSGSLCNIELTPNEYQAFNRHSNDYRLAVISNALEAPVLSICRFSEEQGAWVVDGQEGVALEIKVKQSASIAIL